MERYVPSLLELSNIRVATNFLDNPDYQHIIDIGDIPSIRFPKLIYIYLTREDS